MGPGSFRTDVKEIRRAMTTSGAGKIDAAHIDRFAPLQMTYPPVAEEVKLLTARHPELPVSLVQKLVDIADKVRKSAELSQGLSVRATDEVCISLKHPLFEAEQQTMRKEILKSSFCGRFSDRFDDATSDAGAVWAIVESALKQ